jgi:hypothetical protein
LHGLTEHAPVRCWCTSPSSSPPTTTTVRASPRRVFGLTWPPPETAESDDDFAPDDVDTGATLEPRFRAWGLVHSGTLVVGSEVRVVESSDQASDEAPARAVTEARVAQGGGRASRRVSKVPAGNWALLSGVDAVITKSCALCDRPMTAARLPQIKFENKAVCKLAIEPLVPAELPKLLAGLRAGEWQAGRQAGRRAGRQAGRQAGDATNDDPCARARRSGQVVSPGAHDCGGVGGARAGGHGRAVPGLHHARPPRPLRGD